MKRLSLFLIIIYVACCFSCKKDPGVKDGLIKISDNKAFSRLGDSVSASFVGSCSYSGIIKRIELSISLDESVPNNDNSDTYHARLTDKDFSVKNVRLVADTVYYYRYVVHRYSEEFDKETVWEDSIRVLTTKNLQFVPLVKTIDVKCITQNSAIGYGQIIDDGGSPIIESGFCWSSTNSNPSINDRHTSGNQGEEFVAQMTNLNPGTKYYVCAYAKNSIGYGYGDVTSFNTNAENSHIFVITLDVTDITSNSATFNGKILINYDGGYSSCGFMWGKTEATENIIPLQHSGNYHGDSIDERLFDFPNSLLESNTTYYVRAFAVENGTGDTIVSSIIKSFTTMTAPPVGALVGLFSVGEGEQVYFSKGNLQYQASTNTWRFAENQWDFVGGFDDNDGNNYGNLIGNSNNDIDSCYAGWIDLFNWGTSGYSHGAVCYQPWGISNDYENDYNAYGNPSYNLFDQSGQADWGYNAISNGGNTENNWRTLTKEEWEYLLKTRETSSGIRFAKAKVNNVNGVILLPDNWNAMGYNLQECNTQNASFSSNVISVSSWNSCFKNKGAVFLPEAGQRDYRNQFALAYPWNSCYWSSSVFTSSSNGFAYCMAFGDTSFSYKTTDLRCKGFSVRLVVPIR